MRKTFKTTVVLSLATGIGMGEGLTFSDIHELAEHLAGGPVWTHQLPLLVPEAEAAIIAQIGDQWEPFDSAEGHEAYAARMVAKLGESMEIVPAAKPFHRADAVMADAVEAMGFDRSRVIAVKP